MKLKYYSGLLPFFLLLMVVSSCEEEQFQTPADLTSTPEELTPAVLDEWTTLLLETERYAVGLRPNGSARALAYIYLAAYETMVPSTDDYRSNTLRLQELQIDPGHVNQNDVDVELALNACFAEVLPHFLLNFPGQYADRMADLNQQQSVRLSTDVSTRTVATSEAWGSYVAQQIIAYSQTDTEAEEQVNDPQPLDYEPPVGTGYWTYSADPERALFPYWDRVRTFAISPTETTTRPPLTYSTAPGSPYYTQMLEVYAINNQAKVNGGEQLWIAEFWSDDVEDLMMSPPARQISIANQLKDQYELNLSQSLALFVKVGFALNDAAVATWKYKYQYMVMRPSVYVRELIDPTYETNLFRFIFWPDPGFPGYPSGHSCFASAAGGIFRSVFGNQTNFTDRTHVGRTEFRGAPRTFATFEQMARENAFSRLPLGVHMRMDCAEGLRLGYEIAEGVNRLDL